MERPRVLSHLLRLLSNPCIRQRFPRASFTFHSGEMMGERTSALVSSRTAVPENRAIDYPAALEERHADSYSTRLPNAPGLLHRPLFTVKPPDIAELLAKHQHGEEMDKLAAQLVSQPVYVVPTMKDIEFRMPVRQEKGNDALVAQLVATQAPATAVTDQQSAANCCVCPPCNLL